MEKEIRHGLIVDILALDLATKTGWARGVSGSKPLSGSVKFGKDGLGPGQLGVWLRDHRREHGIPDLIVIEKWINPHAQKHFKPIEVGLRLNGAVHALAGVYGITVAEPSVQTIRAAVCGRSNAGNREDTKAMVIQNMILRGLLPTGCRDDDRADSLAAWVYGEAVYGRMAPKDFILTGE